MITVAITDDHKMLVQGMKKIIEESGKASVTGVAYTAAECRRMLQYEQPDVLLLDINLPDGSGLDLCSELHESFPQLKILALTSYGEYSMVKRMLDHGASGYVLKNAMGEEVIEGILTVHAGAIFLCHEVDMLMKKESVTQIWLTPREEELLRLIVEGYTNPEIAEKICLSPETIKGYRKNLLFKLGAKNTATLVKMAMEQKLV
ncbi:MAG TPA: response regulator transcription factor [Bacteroidales bacterium]|nr:response regulator transcription factor [Bacteroidales bacterium]HPT12469.1 response regulator transcription factor [Bacteroidales bacterium]